MVILNCAQCVFHYAMSTLVWKKWRMVMLHYTPIVASIMKRNWRRTTQTGCSKAYYYSKRARPLLQTQTKMMFFAVVVNASMVVTRETCNSFRDINHSKKSEYSDPSTKKPQKAHIAAIIVNGIHTCHGSRWVPGCGLILGTINLWERLHGLFLIAT